MREQHRDWAEYFEQSIVIRQQGIAAASLYGYPTRSQSWRQAQQLLAVMWEGEECEMQQATLKVLYEIRGKVL